MKNKNIQKIVIRHPSRKLLALIAEEQKKKEMRREELRKNPKFLFTI